jgi:hypothetical protein
VVSLLLCNHNWFIWRRKLYGHGCFIALLWLFATLWSDCATGTLYVHYFSECVTKCFPSVSVWVLTLAKNVSVSTVYSKCDDIFTYCEILFSK